MDIICQPLVSAIHNSWLQVVLHGTLLVIALSILSCLATQSDFFGTHFTAIGRLLLIKFLPIWNWQSLYYENCMVNNPFHNDYMITEEDCVVGFIFENIRLLRNYCTKLFYKKNKTFYRDSQKQ